MYTASEPPLLLFALFVLHGGERGAQRVHVITHPLGVALQVAFERQTLKPVFSLDRL
jgi:hypothetical protein